MKYTYTFLLSVLVFFAFGQVDVVSVGAGYSNMTFYDISSGDVTSYTHDTWDIAFSVFDDAAGVFVNEAIASSMTQVLPQVELYYGSDTDFETADTANIIDRLYNEEEDWSKGAFNRIANDLDPSDYGWGTVNELTGEIEGAVVYFIKLRDDSYWKLQIESLINGVYTFKYAKLDGSGAIKETVNKSNFDGKTLAYYSFADHEVKDLEPANWDLLFTRYTDPIDDGTTFVEYMVTGVLSNRERPIAVATGIDPGDVDFNDYLNDFDSGIQIIGHDWKYFDLGAFEWVLATDQVYFIKTDPETIWQLLFIDFSGSFSGNTTLEKTLVFNTSVQDNLNSDILNVQLTPNPSNGFFNVNIESASNFTQASLRVLSVEGKVVMEKTVPIKTGQQVFPVNTQLSSGIYTVQLIANDFGLSQKLQIINN